MLAWLNHYAAATKALINPFAAIPIRANAVNLILTKQGTELFNCLLGAKRRAYLTHCIEYGGHSFLVRNRQCKAITCATTRIDERAIDVAPVIGPLADTRVNAGFNTFACDKAFNIG